MIKQLIIGLATEGPTDIRFLESIVQRTFEAIAFECEGEVEILPVQPLKKESGQFVETVKLYAQQAYRRGVMVLCIHTDADSSTDITSFTHKIGPAFQAVNNLSDEDICQNLVAIVPIQMTESWMLADKELLKAEIGTQKTDQAIGIEKPPETYSDPKNAIKTAIRLAHQDVTKRRRYNLSITDLYAIMGQKIPLSNLETLSSFQKFQMAVREALRMLHYLH